MMRKMTQRILSRVQLILISAILLLVAFPALAFAADGQTALDNLSTQILDILIPVFGTFIATLAAWVLLKIKAKLHIEVSDKTAAAWEDLAEKAALRAGEWARNKAKTLTDGKKIPGPEILEVGANWAIDMAVARGLPALARNKLEGLIEAKLFQYRANGVPTSPGEMPPPAED